MDRFKFSSDGTINDQEGGWIEVSELLVKANEIYDELGEAYNDIENLKEENYDLVCKNDKLEERARENDWLDKGSFILYNVI